MDNNFLFLCVLQVTLANESIVLYMYEGKVLMDIKVLLLAIFVSFWTKTFYVYKCLSFQIPLCNMYCVTHL